MALRALQQLQFVKDAAAAGTALGQGHQRCGAQRQALRSHGLLQGRGALQHGKALAGSTSPTTVKRCSQAIRSAR